MRVIKRLNNNVAICEDGNGQELIALGKGIGFPKTPYELTDLSKVDMTFYRVSDQVLELLQSIPSEVIITSSKIVKRAQLVLDSQLSPNIVFSLADHIAFAIERVKKDEIFDFSLTYDIEHLYPKEYKLGQNALEVIKEQLDFQLPKSEAVAIAMHFINAQDSKTKVGRIEDNELIDHVIGLIGSKFNITINKKDFAYHRFILHLRYYLQRVKNHNQISDDLNKQLMQTLISENNQVYQCTKNIVAFVDDIFRTQTTDDEMFYLMIYINRIVAKNLEEEKSHDKKEL